MFIVADELFVTVQVAIFPALLAVQSEVTGKGALACTWVVPEFDNRKYSLGTMYVVDVLSIVIEVDV